MGDLYVFCVEDEEFVVSDVGLVACRFGVSGLKKVHDL
jgi:hypothetical protein